MMRCYFNLIAFGLVGTLIGCAATPKSDTDREQLHDQVQSTLETMQSTDPSLSELLSSSGGYAMFPSIGKGGLLVGGAYGRGEVYQQGQMIGYADVTQETIGLQAGGQTFAELIVFKDRAAVDRFRMEPGNFLANATATMNQSGNAKTTDYDNGVAVFVRPLKGLMLEASVGGQQFSFDPK